jgi:phage shock protein PspC (stress-responsive transcriptional regulator)
VNRVLAGLCGGIAETYGSDPTAVRLATVVIGLFTGIVPMVVLYVIAALLIPDDGAPVPGEARPQVAPGQGALVVGAILILIGIASLANLWLRVDWGQIWPIVLIGLGAVILTAGWRR